MASRVVSSAPDGGWGWVVSAGTFVLLGSMGLTVTCFSILFSEFLLSRNVSSTTTAWIYNLQYFLWNVMGLLTGPLTTEFGFRRVSCACAALCSLCFMVLVFASSVWHLMLFFCLTGAMGGLASKPCYLLLTLYFERRRGMANAILMSGVAVAYFFGPIMTKHLLDQYGFQGAILITSAVMFHGVVGASVFHPVEWHMKQVDVEDNGNCTSLTDVSHENRASKGDKSTEDETYENGKLLQDIVKQRMMGQTRIRHISESSMSLGVSHIDLSSIPVTTDADYDDEETSGSQSPNTSAKRKFFSSVARIFSTVIKDLKIVRSPRAVIIILGGVCTVTAYANFLMTAPFAIQNAGFSLKDAAWALSIASLANCFARLSTSALSDCIWFNKRLAYMGGVSILGTSMFIFSFMSDLRWMIVVMTLWGYGAGVTLSLYILLMPQYMGKENMAAIFGVQSLALGTSGVVLGPLLGLIRDLSQSYEVAIRTMSAMAGVAVILWIFMPAAEAYDRKKEQERQAGD